MTPPCFFLSYISPTIFLFCLLWHLVHTFPVTSVSILLPFISTLTLMLRPPGDWLLHPWRFGFPFQLRSGSFASQPGTALSRARHSFYSGDRELLLLVAQVSVQPFNKGEISPIVALQLRLCETMVLGVLGSSLLTCFSLQGLPWRCHGASPVGGLAEGPVSMWLSSSAMNLCCGWAMRSP